MLTICSNAQVPPRYCTCMATCVNYAAITAPMNGVLVTSYSIRTTPNTGAAPTVGRINSACAPTLSFLAAQPPITTIFIGFWRRRTTPIQYLLSAAPKAVWYLSTRYYSQLKGVYGSTTWSNPHILIVDVTNGFGRRPPP